VNAADNELISGFLPFLARNIVGSIPPEYRYAISANACRNIVTPSLGGFSICNKKETAIGLFFIKRMLICWT